MPGSPASHAPRGRADSRRPRPRLYLFTPPLAETATFLAGLDEVLGAGDVAALLLRLESADERTLIGRTKTIAAVVQGREIALLIEERSDIVARAGADGAHLTGISALTAAIGSLRPDRIAGAGGLHSRHDAMLAGETGADYVMFGEPDSGGTRPPFAALLDRLTWWAELFEPPAVGYAATLEEVIPLAQTGADFIALGDWIWMHHLGPRAAVAQAGANLLMRSTAPTLGEAEEEEEAEAR